MKKITWQVAIMDNGKIATLENAVGLPQDVLESHLTIVGILENIKQQHLDKMKTLFSKTVRRSDVEKDL